MNIVDAIKKIIADNGLKKTAIANAENISPQLIQSRLKQKDLNTETAAQMLRGCNYKLVAIPRGAAIPKDGIEID